MNATHKIDSELRIIFTHWKGEASGESMMAALNDYQQTLLSDHALLHYHELVDFSGITDVKLSTEEIIQLGRLASNLDPQTGKHKLALVVGSNLAYGLARMYASYRNAGKKSAKKIAVFREYDPALEWLRQQVDNSISATGI